ncbi:M28 family peptidase [Costertonia aggregata]|uniref:M28 family peptidase n=1 Tax=Costertonia aggregata TaxID=343403 RepID=A0A7H9ATI2_9FLAO|nr:M28 family peptidase [Costertonia aggregata]QLG46764.1 M28 family peptidase [Costertonia aggregata]
MKKIAIVIACLAAACNSSQKTTTGPTNKVMATVSPTTFANTITEAELKEHLYIYASDEFEGRETGQPGQKKAVEYLKKQYEALGIPAAKSDGNYFQNVPLEMSKLPDGYISINGQEFDLGTDILTFSKAEGDFDEIVFLGYGIDDENYSDYTDMDVNGKLVLIKLGEPKNDQGVYRISGTNEPSIWSNVSESFGKRMEIASGKGAKGVIYYDESNFGRFKQRFSWMKNNDSGQMKLKNNQANDFASILVNAKAAKAIFKDIDSEDSPKSVPVKVSLNVTSENNAIASENVIAIVKGSEIPDEYLVLSSHLDHIGVTASGAINNGADDDGSGTVALLEIAEAFKKAADAGNGPKRSIVFLHVTGEEKGLLGSQYYTDVEPIFPLANTVANLNIDMIGRIDPKREGDRNYIYLIGSDKLSTELHELSEEVNKKYVNLELDYTYNDENDPNRFYYRSDHYNFAKNNIPIIFYFNGTHDDYHRPGDTPDKINYDLLQNRTRLVFYTAWEVANRNARVVVDKAAQ